MKYSDPVVEAVFVKRYKRFFADCLVDGELVTAHLANTGRMTACVEPGCPVRLTKNTNPKRKLRWSVEQTFVGGVWIVVNTSRVNRVVEGQLGELFPSAAPFRREVPWPDGGRCDFCGVQGGVAFWVEVKNVTWAVGGGVLAFPDAVSERAIRHLDSLKERVRLGEQATLLFHVGVQRPAGLLGPRVVRPAHEVHPEYADALYAAANAGVQVLAVATVISKEGVCLNLSEPITIEGL